MTADSARDVQAALHARLSADAGLAALLQGRIFDRVPQGTAFPYLVIGETAARAFDTQESFGNEIEATLHVYSRAHGWKETQDILAAVRDSLHEADFTVPGQFLIFCQHAGAALLAESDGETRHGITRFHILTEPDS